MSVTADDAATRGSDFFAGLPLLASARDTFDTGRYRSAPDDWALAVTDIVDSTGAIASGRHKTVNFVAAMAIAALRNLCAPIRIPFLFGGDGAVIMVPPQYAAKARLELARVRGMAARDFEMTLRAGLVPVRELRRFGSDVLVGRYEPTPGNSFGVFLGGGVGLLEASIRGRGNAELGGARRRARKPWTTARPVDLEGLSCRWDTLNSTHGAMLTLDSSGCRRSERRPCPCGDAGRAGRGDASGAPGHAQDDAGRRPGFMLEARARRRGGSLAGVGVSRTCSIPWWRGSSWRERNRPASSTRSATAAKSSPTPISASTTRPSAWSSIARRAAVEAIKSYLEQVAPGTWHPLRHPRLADRPHDLSRAGALGQPSCSFRRRRRRRLHERLARIETRRRADGRMRRARKHG